MTGDTAAHSHHVRRQRISAEAHISSKLKPAARAQSEASVLVLPAECQHPSVINELYQQGSARIRFPHAAAGTVPGVCSVRPGGTQPPLQAVLLNTAGGLTGNDVIRWSGTAHSGSRLCISTAACEKLYRTHGPAAVQSTNLVVESGARIDWLPQETIVFDGGALDRSMSVHVASDASALLVESFILGRQAMHESVRILHLNDQWRIFRDGRLLHAEALRMTFNAGGEAHPANAAQQQSRLHHYRAMSTVVLISPQPLEALQLLAAKIIRLLSGNTATLTAGVSAMEHRLVIRALASNSLSLRQFLIPCIEQLNDGVSIPQVWNV